MARPPAIWWAPWGQVHLKLKEDMMSHQQQPERPEQRSYSAEQLEELYRQYFSPPPQEETGIFKQVSLFDYTVVTRSSDSTLEGERSGAKLE